MTTTKKDDFFFLRREKCLRKNTKSKKFYHHHINNCRVLTNQPFYTPGSTESNCPTFPRLYRFCAPLCTWRCLPRRTRLAPPPPWRSPAFKIKVSATGPVSPPKASRKILALSLASPPAKSFNSHFFIPTLDGSKVYVLTPSLETSMTSARPPESTRPNPSSGRLTLSSFPNA